MSQFKTLFAKTGAVTLTLQFGEDVTYYSAGSGVGRSIKAIIERNVEIPNGFGTQAAQAIVCRVVDDEVLGISSSEIDDARDTISLKIDIGGDYETREITRLTDDSNGMLRFMVR